MRLMTDHIDISTVAERWRKEYSRGDWWPPLDGVDSRVTYDQLRALPPTATRADVAAIVGNDHWIGECCTECEQPAVVLVGHEPDDDSATVFLCRACARKVAALADTADSPRRERDRGATPPLADSGFACRDISPTTTPRHAIGTLAIGINKIGEYRYHRADRDVRMGDLVFWRDAPVGVACVPMKKHEYGWCLVCPSRLADTGSPAP